MPRFTIPILILVGFGSYFAAQACPVFYFWDSAELTAAVLSNGVPHPPGFPAFLVLASIWKGIMPIDPAYALNLFSAFFAALGLALWFIVIERVISGLDFHRPNFVPRILALISIVVMGASFTFGIQATRFEVYSLNFAGFAALMLLALKIRQHDNGLSRAMVMFFALLGLMLGVHNLTIALAMPGLLLLSSGNRGMKLKYLLLGLPVTFAIAAGLYAVIYFKAQGNPALNWGDPSSAKNLFDYIFLKGFSTTIKGGLHNHLINQLEFVIGLLSRQIGIPGLILAALGAVYFTLNNRGIGLAILSIFVLNLFSVALASDYFYENFDLHGYLLISLAITAAYLAVGLEFIYQTASRMISNSAVKGVSVKAAAIAAAFGLAIGIFPVKDNLLSANLSKVTTARSIAEEFLDSSPDNSVIMTSSYNTYFTLLARQASDKKYDNRTILNIYNWENEWGRAQTNQEFGLDIPIDYARQNYYRSFVNASIANRPIYIEYDNSSRPLAGYLYPKGLGYILTTDSTAYQLKDTADNIYLGRAKGSLDIESIRTWVLWLQCRGEYYRDRGLIDIADYYFATLNTVASNADIK